MASPVAIIIFNRPDLTAELMNALREARPAELFVISDGPRNEAEVEKVEGCRRLIDEIDWPCSVTREYAEGNLGCRRRIQSGLTAAFAKHERLTILEDDVIPDPSFFRFCEEMLDRYAEDERIMTVTAGHYLTASIRAKASYYYSIFPSAWGWATWRRAWALYDGEMRLWPQLKAMRWLDHLLGDSEAAAHYTRAFDRVASGQLDTWDYQLNYSIWTNHGLNVVPNRTLCENRGFRDDATHTRDPNAASRLKAQSMPFPLTHPPLMTPSPAAAELYRRQHLPALGPHF